MPQIRITTRKDGTQQPWFRDLAGRRVRTAAGVDWVDAEKIKAVADYGIALQLGQLDQGLGSDGTPMPALSGSGSAIFLVRKDGRATFVRRSYAQAKVKMGLNPIRDLLGPGVGGHMRDDIRINYLDGKQARIAITTRLGRVKALANEKRGAWWGWTAESVRQLVAYAGHTYQTGVTDALVAMGLMSAIAAANLKRRNLGLRRAS